MSCAWLVIQVVETIFPVYGLSDAAIRLVIMLLAIGLIPVVVFAWAFELTPEGFKKEKDIAAVSRLRRGPPRRWTASSW